MDVIFMLIGVSVLVASVFLGAFLWAQYSGQFADSTTPAYRILFDRSPSEGPEPPNEIAGPDAAGAAAPAAPPSPPASPR